MNLASRVLGQSVRRLSGDMRKIHGHPALLAESFIDPSRFTGACYRAANWQVLGRTKGFSRNPGMPVTWTAHGRPKEILVYPWCPTRASSFAPSTMPRTGEAKASRWR